MTKNRTHPQDRSKWGSGPWDNEPENRVDFIHKGYSCFILRGPVGAWCGYVGVPNDHPWYEKDMHDVPVDVHGGITYAAKCDEEGVICHVPEPGMPDDVWWLGFDTAHADDLTPSRLSPSIFKYAVYRTRDYVIQQTKQLAEQLRELHDQEETFPPL